MKILGTLELQICNVESSNIKYCFPTTKIMNHLYLFEKENISGLLFEEKNEVLISFQKEIEDNFEQENIIAKIKELLGDLLFFDYSISNNLNYWIQR